jgi:hypothetical protein
MTEKIVTQVRRKYVTCKGTTPTERFWSKVSLTANPEKCWLWQGSVNKHNGYGTLRVEKQGWLAHIYAWYLIYGTRPTLKILHSCDTPNCVNPRHLQEGTQKANIHDMMLKGRYYHGMALTKHHVKQVLDLYNAGRNRNSIATLLQISHSVVTKIIRGTHWSLVLLQEV